MRNPLSRAILATALVALAAPAVAPAGDRDPRHDRALRVATFNASLNRGAEGELVAELSTPADVQAAAVAEVIQRVRPDVLLVNEFDFDEQGSAARLFQDNYLSVGHNGAAPIFYRYRYSAPSNTGIPSGFDLNNNGTIGGGDDALGFGAFPGQFGMQVYSRHPIAGRGVRTFQRFRWRDMPGARLPDNPATPEPADFYSPAELAVFRLSSKSHWDIPLLVRGTRVHFLVSHPTPPVFDGPEDRNGLRNADEIRFWADYLHPGRRSAYIYDDAGHHGGLSHGARFVIAGDQNSDPLDGDSVPGAIQRLLEHPRIDAAFTPRSAGAVEASALQGGVNATHRSNPALRHRGLFRQLARQPARGLRAAEQTRPEDPRRLRLLATERRPAVAPPRRVPVPDLRPPAGGARPGATAVMRARRRSSTPRWKGRSGRGSRVRLTAGVDGFVSYCSHRCNGGHRTVSTTVSSWASQT